MGMGRGDVQRVELGTESGTICWEVERPAMARSTATGAKESMVVVVVVVVKDLGVYIPYGVRGDEWLD
jgi:hypothetical protein